MVSSCPSFTGMLVCGASGNRPWAEKNQSYEFRLANYKNSWHEYEKHTIIDHLYHIYLHLEKITELPRVNIPKVDDRDMDWTWTRCLSFTKRDFSVSATVFCLVNHPFDVRNTTGILLFHTFTLGEFNLWRIFQKGYIYRWFLPFFWYIHTRGSFSSSI